MNTHDWFTRNGLALGISMLLLGIGGSSLADEVEHAVRKFDLRTREFVPVSAEEIITGKIYNHYSERYNRYVWAYALEGGKFSYALGPGTTEVPADFAATTSVQETERLLEERAYGGDTRSRWEESGIKVRLGADDQWTVLGSAFTVCRSHFDLDSGRRWEWHGNRRVAVGHTNGYTWRYEDDRYVPANRWLGSSGLADGRFLFVPCVPR